MTSVTPSEETTPEHRIFYFEPGEIMLLLEPREGFLPDPQGSIPEEDWLTLRDKYGLPVRQDPCDGRTQIVVNRGEVNRVLQTLTLDVWGHHTLEDAEPQLVKDAVTEVTFWVKNLNDQIYPSRQRHIAAGIHPSKTPETPLELPNYRVIAASPNWLSVPLCWGCGGPGGRPSPVNSPKHFVTQQIRAEVDNRTGTNAGSTRTRVAVFDTWPLKKDNPDPLAKIAEAAARFHQNRRLQEFAIAGNLVSQIKINQGYLRPEWEIVEVVHRNAAGIFELPYDEADHGLFIADLLADALNDLMVPDSDNVEICVYRVLNNTGTGRIEGVARAVEDALADARNDGIQFLVLNLSLGFGPPPVMLPAVLADPTRPFDSAAWAIFVQSAMAKPRDQFDEEVTLTDPSFEALRHLLAMKTQSETGQQVIAIAAAGNDSAGGTHAAPRFPAFMEEVFGVSSVSSVAGASMATSVSPSNVSSFSNDNDSLPPLDGVNAGGEGLVGIFTTTDSWNQTGYGVWDGTSFATPIVAAFAARLAVRGQTRSDIQKLLFNAGKAPTALARPIVPFRQV